MALVGKQPRLPGVKPDFNPHFSYSLKRRRERWRLRLLKWDVCKSFHRRSLVNLLLAAGVAWVCILMLVCLTVLRSCGTTYSSSGPCRKNKLYIMFGALGLLPKPVHRCFIPLWDNPYTVEVPPQKPDETYPLNLTFVTNDAAVDTDSALVPLFGGYQTWEERDESFKIKPQMEVHCGFVGKSGADMNKRDIAFVRRCRFVVASGIFDGYDIPHQPSNISHLSQKLFCFLMVVDETSLRSIEAAGNVTDSKDGGKWIGIWRLILLQNLPYDEPRRNGKVPKLLTHRIFPKTQYSIWIDGKMELLIDPLLILERYLWRGGYKFAIARHKHHRSIYEEADANKRRKRYARPLIDKHMEIYIHEGMEPWSEKKLPVPSDVPEGAIIIREHTRLTNLFCCLWFNEVNRFTPRDQLSFGYVAYRLNGSFPFFMFPNCEYNSLFLLHKHTREHSSKIEWVKSLDELKEKNLVETRGGIGLTLPVASALEKQVVVSQPL
eukprot:c23276_g1_i1 orf=267-1742(+)